MARINTTEAMPFPLAKPNADTPVTEAENIGYRGSNVKEELDKLMGVNTPQTTIYSFSDLTSGVAALSVGSPISVSPNLSAFHKIVPCKQGDVFNVKTYLLNTTALWGFLDSSNVCTRVSVNMGSGLSTLAEDTAIAQDGDAFFVMKMYQETAAKRNDFEASKTTYIQGGGVLERVSDLEDDVSDIKEDITDIEGNISALEDSVSDLSGSVSDLEDTIEGAPETHTTNYTFSDLTSGVAALSVGSPISITTDASAFHKIVPCKQGDVFNVKTYLLNTTALWGFLDSQQVCVRLSSAKGGGLSTLAEGTATAQDGEAYFVFKMYQTTAAKRNDFEGSKTTYIQGEGVLARVSDLESDVSDIKEDITDIEGDISALEYSVADYSEHISDLEDAIEGAPEIHTTNYTSSDLTSGIASLTVGSPISTSPDQSAFYKIVPCNPNDVFNIKTYMTQSGVMWGFLNSSQVCTRIASKAGEGEDTLVEDTATAQEGEAFFVMKMYQMTAERRSNFEASKSETVRGVSMDERVSALEESVSDIEAQLVGETEYKTTNYTSSDLTSGIASLTVGSPISTSPDQSAFHKIVPCKQGDVFNVKTYLLNTTALWGFLDSQQVCVRLSSAKGSGLSTLAEDTVTAQEGEAYFVFKMYQTTAAKRNDFEGSKTEVVDKGTIDERLDALEAAVSGGTSNESNEWTMSDFTWGFNLDLTGTKPVIANSTPSQVVGHILLPCYVGETFIFNNGSNCKITKCCFINASNEIIGSVTDNPATITVPTNATKLVCNIYNDDFYQRTLFKMTSDRARSYKEKVVMYGSSLINGDGGDSMLDALNHPEVEPFCNIASVLKAKLGNSYRVLNKAKSGSATNTSAMYSGGITMAANRMFTINANVMSFGEGEFPFTLLTDHEDLAYTLAGNTFVFKLGGYYCKCTNQTQLVVYGYSSQVVINEGEIVEVLGVTDTIGGILIFDIGANAGHNSNDLTTEDLVNTAKKMIAFHGNDKYLIVGFPNKALSKLFYQAKPLLKKEFGYKFIDIAEKLNCLKVLTKYGITPLTTADLSQAQVSAGVLSDADAIAWGVPPTSLWRYAVRSGEDTSIGQGVRQYLPQYDAIRALIPESHGAESIHVNALGHWIMGCEIYERGKYLGYW